MEYDNTNTGAIFKNETKEGKQPDYRGKINVDGVEKDIALWVSEAKSGKKYFSAKISDPYQKEEQKKPAKKEEVLDDSDLPF